MRLKLLSKLVVSFCLSMVCLAVFALNPNKLIIFGDSLSDNGNTTQLLEVLRKERNPTYINRPYKFYLHRKIEQTAKQNHVPDSLVRLAESIVDGFFDKVLSPAIVKSIASLKKAPLIPVAPYWQHHFSNGKVWNEYFAERLGLDTHNEAQFENHAFGGGWAITLEHQVTIQDFLYQPQATLHKLIKGKILPPSLGMVINHYLLERGKADPSALYVVFAGGNDYLNAFGFNPNHNQAQLMKYSDHVVNSVMAATKQLILSGATQVMVMGVPDVSVAPRFNTTAEKQLLHLAAQNHNQKIKAKVKALQAQYPKHRMMYVDIQSMLQEVIDDPQKEGFSDAQHACIDVKLPDLRALAGGQWYSDNIVYHEPVAIQQQNFHQCAVPNQFVFWDSIHPTTHTHRLLADRLCQLLGQQKGGLVMSCQPS